MKTWDFTDILKDFIKVELQINGCPLVDGLLFDKSLQFTQSPQQTGGSFKADGSPVTQMTPLLAVVIWLANV